MRCSTLVSLLLGCGMVAASPALWDHRVTTSEGRGERSTRRHSGLPNRFTSKAAFGGPGRTAGKKAVGYYGNWDIYAREFFVTDIPSDDLSHIIYSFMNVNTTTGAVYLSDEWADLQYAYSTDNTTASSNTTNLYGNLKQLYLLKKSNRALKTMFSIGGWTYRVNFPDMLVDETKRATFASTALKLMVDLGFDGIDVDYEYVANSTEAAQMIDVLKRLREGMDELHANSSCSEPFLLSYASPAGPDHYTELDFAGMTPYLDFYNFMGFDYSGSWDNITGHAQNLYPDLRNSLTTPFNTSAAIDYYLAKGVPCSKLILGSPLYAHSFNETDGPGTPNGGTGNDGSYGSAGTWDYKDLPIAGSNATVIELPFLGASYSYDAAQKYLLSYDTPNIAKQKAAYILQKDLGGSMWWEVSMDKTGADSLIAATVDTFGGAGALDSSQNCLSYTTSQYANLAAGFPGE